jgi:hypothetical protein
MRSIKPTTAQSTRAAYEDAMADPVNSPRQNANFSGDLSVLYPDPERQKSKKKILDNDTRLINSLKSDIRAQQADLRDLQHQGIKARNDNKMVEMRRVGDTFAMYLEALKGTKQQLADTREGRARLKSNVDGLVKRAQDKIRYEDIIETSEALKVADREVVVLKNEASELDVEQRLLAGLEKKEEYFEESASAQQNVEFFNDAVGAALVDMHDAQKQGLEREQSGSDLSAWFSEMMPPSSLRRPSSRTREEPEYEFEE